KNRRRYHRARPALFGAHHGPLRRMGEIIARSRVRILFVHQNFPGQYKHLAAALARDHRNEVIALGVEDRQAPAGIRLVRYNASRPQSGAHALASTYERQVLAGAATARAANDLKKIGFSPDIICGHPGWGETLFLRDVWPDTRILSFMEFYYR